MSEPASTENAVTTECFRCGYDLRGIDDAQPCPECGLLAERSRRASDELHDTRPRWLRSIAGGVILILVAAILTGAWLVVMPPRLRWGRNSIFIRVGVSRTEYLLPWLGLDAAAILLCIGAALLTVREGYPPADADDRRLRKLLRVAAFVPMLALLSIQLQGWADALAGLRFYRSEWRRGEIAALLVATVGCAPLPLLLFYRLRGLAKRARSAHLAEHCLVVGVGTSLSLLYVIVAMAVLSNGDAMFGHNWMARSSIALTLVLLLLTFPILFLLWSLYLLSRFAVALQRASCDLRRKWKMHDCAT